MKTDSYKITQYSVNSILGFVENAQIAIPEIQRPFVWKDKEVRDLIDSLYEGYPIGYLIVWQNAQVKIRGFHKAGNKKILIDGQQRVTALMASLLAKEVLDDQYQSRRIQIAFNPSAGEDENTFEVYSSALDSDSRWIPDISVFFRKDFSYRRFEKEYKSKNPNMNTAVLEEAVDNLRGIIKHQVGIIELSFLLDIDVVSEIFIRINLQGKPLNQEDFAMSKISVNEQYEGDYIRNCIDYFCHLIKEPSFIQILNENESEFMASSYGQELKWLAGEGIPMYVPTYADVLKVVLIAYFGKSKIGDLVNLLSGKQASKGVVSKSLMKDSFAALSKGVKAFVSQKNFKGFLDALESAGYCCDRLLYSQSVLNYCYAMYLMMEEEGLSQEEKASLIGKWMTMCLVTGHYQNAADSVVQKDYSNIKEEGFASYLAQIEELQLHDDFYNAILPAKFTATTVRTAPYLAYVASRCAADAISLYDDAATMKALYMDKAESYQLLSKKYLESCGFKTRETYGQVANIVYITKNVKGIVKKLAPADYKEALSAKVSEEVIQKSLAANAIPESIFALDDGNIARFLEERRKNMALCIKEYYDSL